MKNTSVSIRKQILVLTAIVSIGYSAAAQVSKTDLQNSNEIASGATSPGVPGFGAPSDTAVCSGDTAFIAVPLFGDAPWNLTYSINGNTPVTKNNITKSPCIIKLLTGQYLTVKKVTGPHTAVKTNVIVTMPTMAKPGYLQTQRDPLFGSKITRITGDNGQAVKNAAGTTIVSSWGTTVQNIYSTQQPWNILEDRMQLKSTSPGYQLMLNGKTYKPIRLEAVPSVNWHWSRNIKTPYRQYGLVTGAGDIFVYDVEKGYNRTTGVGIDTVKVPFNILGAGKVFVVCVKGKEYTAVLGSGPGTNKSVYVIRVDSIQSNPVVCSMIITDPNCGHFNSSMCSGIDDNSFQVSPDGKHGIFLYEDVGSGTVTWRMLDIDINAKTIKSHDMSSAMPSPCLSCIGGNPAKGHFPYYLGHPVFAFGKHYDSLYVVSSSNSWKFQSMAKVITMNASKKIGQVIAYNVTSKKFKSLTNPDSNQGTNDEQYVAHFTGINYSNPGYVFANTAVATGGKLRESEIIAINLDNPKDTLTGLVRLAGSRTNYLSPNCYSCQVHLAVSPSGTRIAYSTTWGTSQALISEYVLDLEIPALNPDSVFVSKLPSALANFSFVVTGKSVQFTGKSLNADSVSWIFADGTAAVKTISPLHVYSTAGTYNVKLRCFNECGVDSIVKQVKINSVTGMEEIQNQMHLTIFPNPAENGSTISFATSVEEAFTVYIFDSMGKLVLEQTIPPGKKSLTLSDLSEGMYIVKINSKDSQSWSRLYVKNP